MTAPRITAEEIAEYRMIATAPVEVGGMPWLHKLLDALESTCAELDRLHADGMPMDREELQRLLNDAHRKGNQEAHEAHRLVREMGLSAQGGEVPPLTQEDAHKELLRVSCENTYNGAEEAAFWNGYEFAQSRIRPAPPHPDTAPPPGFEISEYAAIHRPGMLHGLPKICKRGPGAWAAFVDDTSCMGKDGEVHYEPRPSNRTPEFIALTRFDTPDEAADALRIQPSATPPRDVVEVSREEWEACRELEDAAESALDEVEKRGECDMTGISGAYKMVQEARAQAQPATEREGT